MKDTDVHFLREDGWSLEVLNTLCSLGYELASYEAATCEAHFCTGAGKGNHGFSLHRQDAATDIRTAIFDAGSFSHEMEVKHALTTLLGAGGLRIG